MHLAHFIGEYRTHESSCKETLSTLNNYFFDWNIYGKNSAQAFKKKNYNNERTCKIIIIIKIQIYNVQQTISPTL